MTMTVLTREQEEAQAKAALKRSGYERGGRLRQEEGADDAKDKRMIKRAVGEHETHDHPGKPKTKLKLRTGGNVEGDAPRHRPDKKSRGKAAVNINIISPEAAQGEKQQAAAAGLQAGAKLGAAKAMQAMGGGGGKGPPPPPPARGGPMPAAGGAGGPPTGGAPPGAAMSPDDQPPMKRGGRAR